MEQELIRLSKKIFLALNCRDFARIDFRAMNPAKLYFIEINPLPVSRRIIAIILCSRILRRFTRGPGRRSAQSGR
jgi:hypothetical protein